MKKINMGEGLKLFKNRRDIIQLIRGFLVNKNHTGKADLSVKCMQKEINAHSPY